MRAIGPAISLRQSVRLTYVSTLVNQLLPGGIGGDALRAWFSFREGQSLSHAVSATVLDRAITLLVLLWLAWSISLTLRPKREMTAVTQTLLVQALAGTGLMLGALMLDRVAKILPSLRITHVLSSVATDAARVLLFRRSAIPVLIVTVLGNINVCLSFAAFNLAFEVAAENSVIAFCSAVEVLSTIIPVSIGGWGTREAAMAAMMSLWGLPGAPAVVAAITFGLACLLVTLPGLLYLHRSIHDENWKNRN